MKTKHREEIGEKKNDLSDVLEQLLPYWRHIAITAIVVVVGVAAVGLVSNNRKQARESGWTSLLAAAANRDSTGMQQLAENASGDVAPWAQQSAAQAKLIEASAAVHRDRAIAKRSFEEAIEGFKQAINLAGGLELIEKRCLWGLGQAYEGLFELGMAKDHYQQILDKWPDSSIAKRAQQRIDSLNDPKTQEFYKWFFAQTPTASQLPPSGEIPNLPFEIPDEPDVTIPDLPSTPPSTDAAAPTVDSLDPSADDSADQKDSADQDSANSGSAPSPDSSSTSGDDESE